MAGVKPRFPIVPVPLMAIPAAGSLLLFWTTIEVVRAPIVCGVKVRLKLQLAETSKLRPQPLVRPKSVAFTPSLRTPEINSVACPVLLTVTVCAELVVRTFCPLKFTHRVDKVKVATRGGGLFV